jgi:hypothetical protein
MLKSGTNESSMRNSLLCECAELLFDVLAAHEMHNTLYLAKQTPTLATLTLSLDKSSSQVCSPSVFFAETVALLDSKWLNSYDGS